MVSYDQNNIAKTVLVPKKGGAPWEQAIPTNLIKHGRSPPSQSVKAPLTKRLKVYLLLVPTDRCFPTVRVNPFT